MRHEVWSLPIPTVDATGGTSLPIFNLREAAVCVHNANAFVVSMKVQGKVSSGGSGASTDINDDWFDLPSGAITNAAVLTPIPNGVTHVRIFRTSATSGQATLLACVSGKNARTDV